MKKWLVYHIYRIIIAIQIPSVAFFILNLIHPKTLYLVIWTLGWVVSTILYVLAVRYDKKAEWTPLGKVE